jgi:peptide/nickel transport system permease protein
LTVAGQSGKIGASYLGGCLWRGPERTDVLKFILRRLVVMIPTLVVISIIIFIVIQLPPGDFLEAMKVEFEQRGEIIRDDVLRNMRAQYGFGQPLLVQYFKWFWNVLQGNFGYSFRFRAPVSELIGERLLLTIVITLGTIILSWVVALPIGIYSAIRQYSLGDYLATFIGFFGLSVPSFLFALIFMFIGFKYFGFSVGGLFSNEYATAPWSWGKLVDLLKHLWIPVIVVGASGTAGLIRTLRANLLDQLPKAYVTTARSGGLPEWRVIMRYPVRVALNPFVSTVGYLLPELISGATIVSMVLSLPTAGPILLEALQNQDMYLAGSFVMLLAVLTVIGTLISDILLALLDPRIRFQR